MKRQLFLRLVTKFDSIIADMEPDETSGPVHRTRRDQRRLQLLKATGGGEGGAHDQQRRSYLQQGLRTAAGGDRRSHRSHQGRGSPHPPATHPVQPEKLR